MGLPATGQVRGGTDGGKGSREVARSGFAEVAPGVFQKGSGIEVDHVIWRCRSCGWKSVEERGVVIAGCPDCDQPVELCELAGHRDWFDAEGFSSAGGYFDRGLGMHIESRQHRDRIMKERGLGDASDRDDEAAHRKHSEGEADIDRGIAEQLREWDADPELQRLIAEGRSPGYEWARELIGGR